MGIRVYNTLSRTKEPLQPVQPGKIGMYLCGPTVYKPSHIGHMVGPVIFDAVKRYLVYSGYEVTFVINVTDVDDKLIAEAKKRGVPMEEVAREMTADYMANLEALGIDTVDHFPRATDNIGEIISLIEQLIEKGCAYASDGDVFFDVARDHEYGKLSGRSPDEMQGEGGEAASRKHSLADFALWKSAKPDEPSWDSPWGQGRPGWHIECSAMSRRLLGESFDIHGGGLDLVFPHHENEIAQSECAHGKPQARYWMHNGLMQAADEVGKVGGRQTRASAGDLDSQQAAKISKSKGSSAFSDLLKEHSAESIRFFLLSTHYRSPITYSEDALRDAAARLDRFYQFARRFERISGTGFYDLPVARQREEGQFDPVGDETLEQVRDYRQRFLDAMDDDFNTAGAIGQLSPLLTLLNGYIEKHKLEGPGKEDAAAIATLRQGATTLRELGVVLGLFRQPVEAPSAGGDQLTGKLLDLLVQLRTDLRKEKNFAFADRIRDSLAELGVKLEDRPDGTEWRIE